MADRCKLVVLKLRNLGCIGPAGLEIEMDNIVCLVGRNNSGKSTILRAYELAQGNKEITEQDRCQWTPAGGFPEVELWVHVPDGIMNVDDRWKSGVGSLKLVKSRWRWRGANEKPVRQTWDPEANGGSGDWAEGEKAGGADNVFKSRLPQPLRVSSLGDAMAEHEQLLKLIIDPIASDLRILQQTAGTPLQAAIQQLISAVNDPVQQYQQAIDEVRSNVEKSFSGVFPDLAVQIRVRMDTFVVDAAKELAASSGVRFVQGDSETGIRQQGTGSRRALFWTLLQVRNLMMRERKLKLDRDKQETDKLRAVTEITAKIEKERNCEKPNEKRLLKLDQDLQEAQRPNEVPEDETSLPGHILLIDEPENALHPLAVRAAREHLYSLACDPNWQVMLSTHSPYSIDPLEDNTTILRLEREGKNTTPRTYRTATAVFSADDRASLRALLQLDISLAEMFFGSYPIIVEGDTETAAFFAALIPDTNSPYFVLIPARGKTLIAPLIRLLAHFKVDFGVFHDTDAPMVSAERKNSAWAVNKTIVDAIVAARANGVIVRHRVSVPDFERRLGGLEETRDKPILAYRKISGSPDIRAQVRELFSQLAESAQHQPTANLVPAATSEQIMASIKTAVVEWAAAEAPQDPRFTFPE
jgi:putative ATP-dependent endonuclease of the OLD family